MSIRQETELNPNTQYTHGSTCSHCAGVSSHETWCITSNSRIRYAFGIVVDGRQLTLGDELILHALGVEWKGTSYRES